MFLLKNISYNIIMVIEPSAEMRKTVSLSTSIIGQKYDFDIFRFVITFLDFLNSGNKYKLSVSK